VAKHAASRHRDQSGGRGNMADGEATVWAETGVLLRLAIPSSLANMTLGVSFCVVLMISQFGTDAIAGAGLGLMWVNITAQSLFVGSQFGLGALSAQAFGARNHRRVGLLLQRQLLMNWVLCVPIACIWFWTEELLLALGQPPRVSAFAGQFVRWQLPGLPFMPVWMGLMTFLRSQGLVRLPMVVSLVNGALGLLLCYGMTRETALGFAGAPLSTSAIHFAQAATLRYLTPRALAHPTWIQWEREGLHGWCELITIGLGNSIGLWAEWCVAQPAFCRRAASSTCLASCMRQLTHFTRCIGLLLV
jgi:MATE family multidrug resistance protein